MPSKQRSADRKWVRLNTSPVRLMAKQQQNTKCVGVIQAVLRGRRKKTGYYSEKVMTSPYERMNWYLV